MTIEYTAPNSFDYYQQVIQSLSRKASADRSFSFRQQFADQWYDLNNPDQSATPMIVKFRTTRDDFPPNLDDLGIQQLMLYIVPADPTQPVSATVTLSLTQPGAPGNPDDHWQASGATVDGTVSTRRGWPWSGPGKPPIGDWELALSDGPAGTGDGTPIVDHFKQGQVQDILFVVTYNGLTPAWPA